MTVLASVGVVAAGFVPAEALDIAQPAVRRVVRTPPPIVVLTPSEMEIPRLGVRSPIVPVGTESDGTMASPGTGVDVGWWSGRRPGQGNALFDAHVDWAGKPGPFARLSELEPNDTIIVRGDGREVTYRVVWARTLDRNIDATEVLGNASGEQIATLITCFGPFDRTIGTRRERLVVRAVLSV